MPPTRHRQNPLRPDWLRATPLGRDLVAAIQGAERLNALFDRWRGRGPSEFDGLCVAYLESRAFRRLAPRTKRDYQKLLFDLKDPAHFGGAALAEVTPQAVEAFRDMLERRGSGLAGIDYRLKVLRLLFAWATKQGRWSGANPAAGRIEPAYRPRRQVWSREGVRAAFALPHPSGLAAHLALFTLQRQGDILAMRWDHVRDGAIRVVQGKSNALLFLPIHPHLEAALGASPQRGDWLLTAGGGGPYTPDGFRALWRRHKAGIKDARDCTFHDLRRTATSWLTGAGLGDDEVRLWTGHQRRGGDRVLDVYDVRLRNLRVRSFPVMDDWKG
ncbi:MAG: tyrosine-type recombinase/integrase [Geminicoccaceae bacterium]|nr:tyrosine-type recombinase/integrase [Geminicoccaceae bacterium]